MNPLVITGLVISAYGLFCDLLGGASGRSYVQPQRMPQSQPTRVIMIDPAAVRQAILDQEARDAAAEVDNDI